jgi:hypothetical protein
MKPLLFVLLAASLVANVALFVSSRRSAPAASAMASTTVGGDSAATATLGQTPSTAAPNRPEAQAAIAATAAVPIAWHTTNTDQDLHRVVAGLRAAGYPPAIIRAVINQLLNERFASRQPNAGQPFWKRSMPTPETAAAQTALNNERQTLFESLLGPDARASALLDTDARERRYGALADDKIDAIARIERDYNEMSAESWAKRKGNVMTSMDTMLQSQQLMEKEKLADLAGVLTPEELTQYEMRNSNAARMLFNNLRNVDITEAEYARLYQAQKAFAAANPPRNTADQTYYLQRQAAQMALNEEARAVLGDARFYSYLEGADNMYAITAQALNKYPVVTPAAMYQVYQVQVELQGQMAQNSRNGPMSPEQVEVMKTVVASANAKLDSLVGPEIAEAYRNQGMGQIFKSFRQAPRPATPSTSLVPIGK